MNLKDFVQASVMVGLGFVLHTVCPPILFGMKPDFTLVMLFLVVLNKRDFKLVLLTSLGVGIITALTTGFPGGQIPNLIDKLISGLAMYFLVSRVKIIKKIIVVLVGIIGSLLSASIFLLTASILVGLPTSGLTLFIGVAIPGTLMNVIVLVILQELMQKINSPVEDMSI
ncbi:MAG: tryptophan transporter [Halanaerobiales bacterium]|nr:tryptophan transporter [Halanaerobiales bacterium]